VYHIYIRIYTCIQVFGKDAGKTTDIETESFVGYGSYILLFAFRRDWETSFEHIHAKFIQLPGNLEFLLVGE
jgi:hypothetical protein